MTEARIGVCSWSLRPSSPVELIQYMDQVDVRCAQIALDPLRLGTWSLDETVRAFAEAGHEIRAGMMATEGEDYSSLESIRATGGVRLDGAWSRNLEAARVNAEIAAKAGIDLVTFHAGFIPHERNDPLRTMMLDRLRQIIDRFQERGISVAFETGQETAATLLDALNELDRPIGVNFDPANMILYGMGDPVEGLRQLAPHVRQIHVKDARAAQRPGEEWGSESPVGSGDVNWREFFHVVRENDLDVDFMIEREAGNDRVADIITARRVVERFL